MRRPLGPLALMAAVAAGGCGAAADEQLPVACTESQAAIVRSLAAAPGPVALRDGTRLSDCVAAATSDAELQNLGLVFTAAADRLADQGAALQLGYLVGAARRGSRHASGVQLELVRRLENSARRVGDGTQLQRGLVAGEARG